MQATEYELKARHDRRKKVISPPQFVFCYDLEGTILVYDSGKIQKREGLDQLFEKQKKSGHIVTLTTACNQDFTQEVLTQTGLVKYFDEIFSEIGYAGGKRYDQVLERFKLDSKAASERMLIIGDNVYDAAVNIEGVVLLLDTKGIQRPADQLSRTINYLNLLGNGHFYNGFKKLSQMLRDGTIQHILKQDLNTETVKVSNINSPVVYLL